MKSVTSLINRIPGISLLKEAYAPKADPARFPNTGALFRAFTVQELEVCMSESLFYNNLSADDKEIFADHFLTLALQHKGEIHPLITENYIAQSLDKISVKPPAGYSNAQRAEVIAHQWQNLYPAVKHLVHADMPVKTEADSPLHRAA